MTPAEKSMTIDSDDGIRPRRRGSGHGAPTSRSDVWSSHFRTPSARIALGSVPRIVLNRATPRG